MNLVVLADDAFSYLLCWEFMSLSSWALVMAHHREAGTARAGFIYLLTASFGTLALLLAFGLLAGPAGGAGIPRLLPAPPPACPGPPVSCPMSVGGPMAAPPLRVAVFVPRAHASAPHPVLG